MEIPSILTFTLIVFFTVLLLFLSVGIKVLPMNQVMVIERLGVYYKTVDIPGVHFLIPFVDRVKKIPSPFGKIYKISTLPQETPLQSPHFKASITFQITDVLVFIYSNLLPFQSVSQQLHHVIDNQVTNSFVLFAIQDIQTQKDVILNLANERSTPLGFRYLELNHIEVNKR
jgi:regulator of protease activity HflC (stomatin/prohibitin superfamily)